MPKRQYVQLSKNSLKRLSLASIEHDVRVNELADAIISGLDWEGSLPDLIRRITSNREAKEGKDAPESEKTEEEDRTESKEEETRPISKKDGSPYFTRSERGGTS